MSNIVLVADFLLKEYNGGAEMVNDTLARKLDTVIIKSSDLKKVDDKTHYILTSVNGLDSNIRQELINKRNYSIFEHDYRIHRSRNPSFYSGNKFPQDELINLDLLAAAKIVYVQSNDHLECYKMNTLGIPINLTNLSTSIWSDEEIDTLTECNYKSFSSFKFAICDNPMPLKGKESAVKWCENNRLDYELIPKTDKISFYKKLSDHPVLVTIPAVKESFCRLVVEARCMFLNVITPQTYGAVLEPWYTKYHGHELIALLEERTTTNIELIKTNV